MVSLFLRDAIPCGSSIFRMASSARKPSYQKNETAKFNLSWSASADSFPGARKTNAIATPQITLDLSVKDGTSKNCIKPINKVINENLKDGKVEIQAPILTNCDNITATLALRDNTGSLLVAKALYFKATSTPDEKLAPSSTKVLIVFVAIVVIGLGVYFINKNKKVNENETKNEETI